MHRIDECPVKSARQELEEVVFTKVDARWVHHPHSDVLVIIAKVTNSNVHRMLVDNGSVVDISALTHTRGWVSLRVSSVQRVIPEGTSS